MAVGISHPAVRAVLEALDDPELTVRAVVDRDDEVIAVVMDSDSVRHTVIVQQRHGEWQVPHMVGGRGRNFGSRPRRTTPWAPFFDHSVSQSGWPGADGRPPQVAWQAVTGFAAEDAVAVAVVTSHDAYEAEVGPDGFFATLARAAWRETPSVSVRLRDGDVVNVKL